MNESVRHYATATAFRVALETRLKAMEKAEGIDLQRLRRHVSFDRLLARFFSERPCPWLLKGGYAMELRVRTARNTKDVDLSLPAGTEGNVKEHVLQRLQVRAALDLEDFFTFTIGEPMMELDAAPEGGARYPVTALVASNHHFTSSSKECIDYSQGKYGIEVFATLLGNDLPTSLRMIEVTVDNTASVFSNEPEGSIWFDWHPNEGRYQAHLETQRSPRRHCED